MISRRFILAFALAGCGQAMTKMSPPPAAPPHLTVDNGDYLFDTVMGAPPQHDFVFVNEGGTSTGKLSTTLSGDLANFAIVSDKCDGQIVGAAQSCKITMALSAPVDGAYAAQLFVSDSIVDGVAATMSGKVSPANVAISAAKTTSVNAGTDTPVTTFTVTNDGGATTGPLTVSSSSGAVAMDNCTGALLVGGASCTFQAPMFPVPLAATSSAVVTGNVSATPGGSANAQASYTVNPAVMLQVANLDFGNADPVFASGNITVTNPTTAGRTGLLTTSISGGPSSVNASQPFTIVSDSCNGKELLPGQGCDVYVVVAGGVTIPGTYTGTLTVTGPLTLGGTGNLSITTIDNHGSVGFAFAGTGAGKITDMTGFALCETIDSGCATTLLKNGDSATFKAVASSGSVFAGWSGACTGTGDCVVTASNDASVTITATFNPM